MSRVTTTEQHRPASLLAPLAVLVISGLAAGWSITHTMVSNIGAGEVGISVLALVGFSLVVAVAAMMAWSGVADARRGLSLWHGAAAALAGGGLGVLLAGVTDDADEAFAFGVVTLVVAALCFGFGALNGGRLRRRATLADEVMETGTRTAATVLDRGYVAFGESTQINTPVVFGFTDVEGVARRVEKRLLILPHDPIENGQETTLWYDPANPDDEERIVVQLQREHPAP